MCYKFYLGACVYVGVFSVRTDRANQMTNDQTFVVPDQKNVERFLCRTPKGVCEGDSKARAEPTRRTHTIRIERLMQLARVFPAYSHRMKQQGLAWKGEGRGKLQACPEDLHLLVARMQPKGKRGPLLVLAACRHKPLSHLPVSRHGGNRSFNFPGLWAGSPFLRGFV